MSASRTTTTTVASTGGPSRSHPTPPPSPPADSTVHKEEGLEDKDKDNIIRRAQERVKKVRARKAAEAARKKAEEEAARVAAEKKKKAQEWAKRARQQREEVVERRRLLAAAATTRSQRGTSPSEMSASPWRAIVEIWRTMKSKGKGKARAEKILGALRMMQGEKDLLPDAGWPSTVKWEGGSNPTGEHLAVLESQVAQLLANNWQLRDGQVKANTYHRHFNRKLNWLITDAARRRKSPPEMPEAGPSGLSRKRQRVVDSNEKEEREIEEQAEKEVEKDGEGEEEEMAPTEA
ncbi:hypothetical protein GG344DRAFT_81252 [Lentinula edodes]|nr:hypothetical protein GG344DRAFT_81252 [Lentinula edodes]